MFEWLETDKDLEEVKKRLIDNVSVNVLKGAPNMRDHLSYFCEARKSWLLSWWRTTRIFEITLIVTIKDLDDSDFEQVRIKIQDQVSDVIEKGTFQGYKFTLKFETE